MNKINDPLLSQQQWYFNRIGLDRVLDTYRGSGVSVGIYDDGLQSYHPDLIANYDASRELKFNGTLATPGNGLHGTAVAGVIAASADNGLGGAGIASEATITGVNIFTGVAAGVNMISAISQMNKFDVTNSSWKWSVAYSDSINIENSFGDLFRDALDHATTTGRQGLGTIIINAVGNEWNTDHRDANTSAFNQHRATITVGAIDDTGTVSGYSNRGASVFVTAPSSGGMQAIVTTDLAGAEGASRKDYVSTFGGTSAAAPIVSGVVALMLEANPLLGWRDVQEILALTADRVGSGIGFGIKGGEQFPWQINGATNWNGGGFHFSNDYGFGQVNAYSAVQVANAWSLFGAVNSSANEQRVSTTVDARSSILDGQITSIVIDVEKDLRSEHVDLTLTLSHGNIHQLSVDLVSPSGTRSNLLTPSSADALSVANWTWTLGSEAFRGESSEGSWRVEIRDTVAGQTGALAEARLDMYGSDGNRDTVYHFTGEALSLIAMDPSRFTLRDMDEGNDWINGVSITQDTTIDLRPGGYIAIEGVRISTLDPTSIIENVATGSGNNTIVGNAIDNHLVGGSGNDTIEGGAGNDLLTGGSGVNTFVFGHNFSFDQITDFVSGKDHIRFTSSGLTAEHLQVATTPTQTVIHSTEGTIALTGVSQLNQSDFQFG